MEVIIPITCAIIIFGIFLLPVRSRGSTEPEVGPKELFQEARIYYAYGKISAAVKTLEELQNMYPESDYTKDIGIATLKKDQSNSEHCALIAALPFLFPEKANPNGDNQITGDLEPDSCDGGDSGE